MRFKITMRPLGNGEKLLPINYQYPAASWIYKTIAGGDADYARWLHENGFADGSNCLNPKNKLKQVVVSLLTFNNIVVSCENNSID